MEKPVLVADPRTMVGKKVKVLRRQGLVPGVLYGSGIDGMPIQLDAREAERLLSQVSASTLIDLKVGDEEHKVLVRDVQRDVIRLDLVHIDFLKASMDVRIRTTVPVELVGEAPAVEDLGGVLVTGVTELEIEALPADLPDRIVVDLEPLAEIDDAITVGSLYLEEGVKVFTDPDENVAHVIYMAEEEEEEEEELEGLLELAAEPELVDQRGVEEEGEEGERPAAPPEEEEED